MALRNQEIGARLRELRGQKPQTTVAEELGVAERTYQNWEGGDAKPSYRNLQRLAVYFGVGEEFILAGEQTPDEPERTHVSPLAGPDALAEALGVLEAKVDRLLVNQGKILGFLEEIDQWTDLGERIEARLDAVEAHVTGRVDDSAARLAESVQDAVKMLRTAEGPRAVGGSRRAGKTKPAVTRSPRASS